MEAISTQLHSMVESYVNESLLEQEFTSDLEGFQTIFNAKYSDSIEYRNAEAEHLAEIRVIEKDLGLNLTTNYSHNFLGSVLDEDGAFYDWRTSGGLNWDILKSGWVDHKQQAAQKRFQWEAEKSRQVQNFKDLTYRKSYDFIIYTFNQKKIEVIQRRLDILDQLLDVANSMFYLRFVQWDHVLEVMSKKAETELFLKNYSVYLTSVQLDSTQQGQYVGALPVFDLDFDRIKAVGIDTISEHLALQNKLAALEHQFHWSKDVNLSAQLRYNYYAGSNIASGGGRDFVAGGISFGIPLPLSKRPKREWKEAKITQLKSSYETFQNGLHNELLNHFYEYEYALKQYVSFFYKKERVATLIDRGMRKKRLDNPDYSPLEVVDRLEELFSIDIELLDIQQKMYLKALKIFSLINSDQIEDFILIQDFAKYATKTPGGRSIFCDAGSLQEMETKYLVEFIKYNGAEEVLAAVNRNPELYLKYAELLDALKGSNTQVRMTFKPEQIDAASMAELEESISFALTSRVHIDFSGRKLTLEEKYLIEAFLERNHASFDLSIALGIHEDSNFRRRLYPFVSYVNIIPEFSEQLLGMFHEVQTDRWNGIDKMRNF